MTSDDPFVIDIFLACITGLVAADYNKEYVYPMAKALTQQIWEDNVHDNEMNEGFIQAWPTKDS